MDGGRQHRASVTTLIGEDVRSLASPGHLLGNMLQGDGNHGKNIFFLHERCNGLLKSRLFSDCIPLLEQLLIIDKNQWFKLKTQLKLTECAIRCDMKSRAELETTKTRKLVLAMSNLDFQDLVRLAEEYECQNRYIDALLLYICSIDILKTRQSSKEHTKDLPECFIRIRNIAQSLKNAVDEAKSLASAMTGDCLVELLEQFRRNNITLDAKVEAICINNVAIVLSIAGRLHDAKAYFRQGLTLLEDAYPLNPSKNSVYGNLLNNLGRVSLSCGYATEAKTYFMKSIMAWNLAENFLNDDQKIAQISATLSKIEMIEKQRDGK